MVARLRLAKVYLYQGKPEEVLTLLSGYEESGFAARYSEAIGDAHYALGDFTAAASAWQEALTQDNSNGLVDATLIEMKIADLPSGDGAAAEVPGIPGLDDQDAEGADSDAADDDQGDGAAAEVPGIPGLDEQDAEGADSDAADDDQGDGADDGGEDDAVEEPVE
jgi:hypothetical protein